MNGDPVVVALPIDDETDDIIAAALQLGQRLDRAIVVVHALARRSMESERGEANRIAEAEEQLAPHLATLRDAGLEVRVLVEVQRPADLVLETAHREHAELIVTGGGQAATVRRWLVGSVAEAVVRRASVPVWVVRGAPPIGQTVLCPVDLSPQSKQALQAAIRMARALEAPLRVLRIVTLDGADDVVEAARVSLEELLAEHELEGLELDVQVVRGDPAECIVESAEDAGLVVVGSRGFDPLAPAWLGPVTTRTLRYSSCNALTIREVDVGLKRRENAIAKLADDYEAAWELMNEDREAEALPILESAAQRAPANATIQEAFAIVLDRMGRHVEARGRREIAEMIRKRIDAD